jgi:hypothetical protein
MPDHSRPSSSLLWAKPLATFCKANTGRLLMHGLLC